MSGAPEITVPVTPKLIPDPEPLVSTHKVWYSKNLPYRDYFVDWTFPKLGQLFSSRIFQS